MWTEFPVLNNIITSCNIYVIAHTRMPTYKNMDIYIYAYFHMGTQIYISIMDCWLIVVRYNTTLWRTIQQLWRLQISAGLRYHEKHP